MLIQIGSDVKLLNTSPTAHMYTADGISIVGEWSVAENRTCAVGVAPIRIDH